MDRVASDYYKFTIAVLSGVGLWPRQNNNIRLVQNFVIIVALSMAMVLQVTTMITHHYTVSKIIKAASPFSISLGFFSKYVVFLFNQKSIQGLLIHNVSYDWFTVENDEEFRIMSNYANKGDRFAKMFAYNGLIAVMVWISMVFTMFTPFSAEILNVLSPLNATRSHNYPLPVDYPGDGEKYFYSFSVYIDFLILVGCTTFVGTEALTAMYTYHSISLLKIVSYRFQKAISDSVNGSQKCSEDKGKLTLIKAIVLHKRVIKFIRSVQISQSVSYTMLLICGVAALSANLFWLSQSVSKINDETMISSASILSIFLYMLYLNYMSQDVNDSKDALFTTLYDSEWYQTPVSMQKSLLIIMLKTMKAEAFNLMIVFTPSLEGFATLVKTSVSYFMMMYSIQ